MGALAIKAVLFGVSVRVPCFLEIPMLISSRFKVCNLRQKPESRSETASSQGAPN